MKTKNRRVFLKNSIKIIGGLSTIGMFGAQIALAKKPTNNKIKEATMSNITDNASKKFTKLFGNTNPLLAQSDQEFFANYVNFAFDEVVQHSKLEEKENLMIILASLVAIPALSEYKNILNAALNVGVSPIAIKEIIYQATPYVGMGKTLDFILSTNEIFKSRGISLPLEAQSTTNRQNRKEKGLNIQRQLFGNSIDRGNEGAPQDQKHIRDFLSANCFGDYYTRNGLDLKFRELLTFVYILSMGGADSQVKSHVIGNINIGNDRARLISVVTALIPYIGYPRSLNAISAINEITQ